MLTGTFTSLDLQKYRDSSNVTTVLMSVSYKNTSDNHDLQVRFFVHVIQKSFKQFQSVDLQTCKSLFLQTVHIYIDSL